MDYALDGTKACYGSKYKQFAALTANPNSISGRYWNLELVRFIFHSAKLLTQTRFRDEARTRTSQYTRELGRAYPGAMCSADTKYETSNEYVAGTAEAELSMSFRILRSCPRS